MKFLRLALLWFAFCSPAFAQVGQIPTYLQPTPGGGAPCSQYTTWLAATSGTSPTEKAAAQALICGLVTDGDFSHLIFVHVYATNSQATALVNMVNPGTYDGVTHGTVSFSADHGYTGDASTFYISTGFDPSTAGSSYTATSSSIGVYIPTSRTTGQAWFAVSDCIATCAIGFHDVVPKFTGTDAYAQFGGNANTAMTDAAGLTIGVRTSASAMALWKNGVSLVSNSAAAGGLPDATGGFFIFGQNHAGTAINLSGDLISADFVGDGGINVFNVSCRVNTYMTTLGINFYSNSGCPL